MQIKNIIKQIPKHPTKHYTNRNLEDVKMLVTHCTDIEPIPGNPIQSIINIANYDIAPGNHIDPSGTPGHTYTFTIDPEGTIFQTQPLSLTTWHAGKWNRVGLGIALLYKPYDGTNRQTPPKDNQYSSLIELNAQLSLYFKIVPKINSIVGHRELEGTGYKIINGEKRFLKSCPGYLINLDILRKTVIMRMQEILKEANLYNGEIDGLFGPKSKQALEQFNSNLKLEV